MGCGEGYLSLGLATHCLSVTAVDYDPGCVQRATERAGERGLENVTFVTCNVASIRRKLCPLVDNEGMYSVILAKNALQFFDQVLIFSCLLLFFDQSYS